jgi:hypothetical protein
MHKKGQVINRSLRAQKKDAKHGIIFLSVIPGLTRNPELLS